MSFEMIINIFLEKKKKKEASEVNLIDNKSLLINL